MATQITGSEIKRGDLVKSAAMRTPQRVKYIFNSSTGNTVEITTDDDHFYRVGQQSKVRLIERTSEQSNAAVDALRDHVSGAIERGEADAVVERTSETTYDVELDTSFGSSPGEEQWLAMFERLTREQADELAADCHNDYRGRDVRIVKIVTQREVVAQIGA